MVSLLRRPGQITKVTANRLMAILPNALTPWPGRVNQETSSAVSQHQRAIQDAEKPFGVGTASMNNKPRTTVLVRCSAEESELIRAKLPT